MSLVEAFDAFIVLFSLLAVRAIAVYFPPQLFCPLTYLIVCLTFVAIVCRHLLSFGFSLVKLLAIFYTQ